MKDKRCFLCKYNGNDEVNTADNILYGKRGKTLLISLCYNHGVELFKVGQLKFASKYGENFKHRFGAHEDDEIIDIFTKKSKDFFDF